MKFKILSEGYKNLQSELTSNIDPRTTYRLVKGKELGKHLIIKKNRKANSVGLLNAQLDYAMSLVPTQPREKLHKLRIKTNSILHQIDTQKNFPLFSSSSDFTSNELFMKKNSGVVNRMIKSRARLNSVQIDTIKSPCNISKRKYLSKCLYKNRRATILVNKESDEFFNKSKFCSKKTQTNFHSSLKIKPHWYDRKPRYLIFKRCHDKLINDPLLDCEEISNIKKIFAQKHSSNHNEKHANYMIEYYKIKTNAVNSNT